MKNNIKDKGYYIKRWIHEYPKDKRIAKRMSLSLNGITNILALYHNKSLAGFLILDFFDSQISDNCANIYLIYINPRHKSNLVRNMLIKEAINISKDEGFKLISYRIKLENKQYINNRFNDEYRYFTNKGFKLEVDKNNHLYFIKKINTENYRKVIA